MRKNEIGITLIALVITIIILLILAGVSLFLVWDKNGILRQAQNATLATKNEEEKEQIEMAVVAAQTTGHGVLIRQNLEIELKKIFGDENVVNEMADGWMYSTDKKYAIYKTGKVEEIDALLPVEYQQIEYIESTGTQYINTKVIPKETLNGKFEIVCLNWGYPFGSTNGQDRDYWGINLYGYDQNCFECYFGTGKYPKIGKWEKNVKYTISIENKKFYCDDLLLYDFANSDNIFNFDTIQPIYLFGLNYRGGDYREYKFYSAILYDDKSNIRNFIPCYSTVAVTDVDGKECPIGTIGMYDLVEGKFYTNQGTGEFIKGPDM